MATLSKPELLSYMQRHKLTVVATVGEDGAPEAALLGIAVTDAFEIIFDTLSTTRKHANLLRNPRIAVVFSGPEEQTLQYEGVAAPVSPMSLTDKRYRESYYAVWPDGRERVHWPSLIYWRIASRWARYSDYGRGPMIVEFDWRKD